ncbi:MAG: carboxypeptidase-like regulatory domain-containing protein [bacterium]|nr:carboxypeptidase-like regulatory domain-containing protein [bacterium]
MTPPLIPPRCGEGNNEMFKALGKAVMLKKYLWYAIVPALAAFFVGCVSTSSKQAALPPVTPESLVPVITDSTSSGRITGIVLDEETKKPLPGAVVTILGTKLGANTDLDGNYTIVNVRVGTYAIQAKMMGFDPQTITGIKVVYRTATPINFKLNPKIIEMEGTVVKKPNIYLYPTKQETLTIQVTPGKITTSIPNYNTGWNVVVAPGGRINETYDFLFYEATVDFNFTLDVGWVLQSSDFDRRMNEILVNIGLNDKERQDFMDYWPKRMDWKKKYCITYYLKRSEIDKAVPLTISKTPESLLRAFFKFVPTDAPKVISEPKIEKFQRKGFTVVEWGGILD